MIANTNTFIGLIISTVLVLVLFIFINNQKRKTELKKSFLMTLFFLMFWCTGLISQIFLTNNYGINPIYADYFVYINICFTPIAFLVMSLKFTKPNKKLNAPLLCLLCGIVPIICLLVLWTNDFHHLFYIEYSTMFSEGVYGPFFYITSVYTYLLFGISLFLLANYCIKNIKTYLIQSLLVFIGALIPIVVNVMGVLGIFNLSIYVTPICFSITMLCFSLSIFRFGFLKITPIALKKIVNSISDSYIVLNNDLIIEDCNETFLKTFNITMDKVINKNFFNTVNNSKQFKASSAKLLSAIETTTKNLSSVSLDLHFTSIHKYFNIEVTSLQDNNVFLGTLLLFKDVTQHQLDLQTIKNNQDILIERERLASLGQMIGGIAHNLKTPIMSISGASEGLLDLIHEYSSSVGDPEVTNEDHLEIASDMEEWIRKIQTHLSYMSDVITTVKGQAVAFSDTSFTSFTIDDLIKQVNILMKHELSHALVELEEVINLPNDTVVKGNINSLVQVVNNIISNAIQAYNGEPGKKIILELYKDKNNLVVKIQDFAGGLPDTVKQKLFKEMITTKGKNGSGLGLFMSYSNIKAHFNGNLRFETKNGTGTSFFIEIPL